MKQNKQFKTTKAKVQTLAESKAIINKQKTYQQPIPKSIDGITCETTLKI